MKKVHTDEQIVGIMRGYEGSRSLPLLQRSRSKVLELVKCKPRPV